MHGNLTISYLLLRFRIPNQEKQEESSEYLPEDNDTQQESNVLCFRTLEQISEDTHCDCDAQFSECPVSLLQMLLGLQIESVEMRR